MDQLRTLAELGALNTHDAALIAAGQASEAVADLIRFARDGECGDEPPFEVEVVGKLAEALKLAIEIHGEPTGRTYPDLEEIELLRPLQAALTRFIEGWVG